jgi:hypothetical protein
VRAERRTSPHVRSVPGAGSDWVPFIAITLHCSVATRSLSLPVLTSSLLAVLAVGTPSLTVGLLPRVIY